MKLAALALALVGLVDAQGLLVSRQATPTQRSFSFPPKSQHQYVPARLRARHDDGTVDSDNWSGYAVSAAAGSVTDVTGSWIVPTANCTSGPLTGYAAFWVGIDGFTSSTVEQIGTDSDCSNGTPKYYVWYEFYPSPSLVVSSLTISPGDVISAEVKYTGNGQFTASLTVVSTGNSFSISKTVSSALRSSAEWIAEAPSSSSGILPLANFGSVLYGHDQSGVPSTCDATVSGTAGPIASFGTSVSAITMVGTSGTDEGVPTGLSPDGTSFSVAYTTPAPALSIAKTHSGDFTQGQTNAEYTVTVSNQSGAAATSGTVKVIETPPSGLALASMSGTGWSCDGTACSRNGSLAGGMSYPAITVLVNVAANASSPQVNQVSVSGGGSATASTSDSTIVIPSTSPVTIQTDPSGLQFSLDGTVYPAPQTLNLSLGPHTIAVVTPQAGTAGTQYVFTNWSDNGAASHSITVGSGAATYTASFQTQYQLTVSASPVAGGTVTPASGTFYNAGTAVPITAAANAGYAFNGWTGSVANAASATATVTMSAPESVTGTFSSLTGITIQTIPAGLRFSVDGGTAQTAPQTLNLSPGPHTIAVVTPQAGTAGTQYVFTNWSDNGSASHSITVGSSAATYAASFQTQCQLTISASPVAGGTVTPASGTFYNAGTAVPITAAANVGYAFNGWTGSVANAASATTTVTMSAPESITGNFLLLNEASGYIELPDIGVFRSKGGLGMFALDLDQSTYAYSANSTLIDFYGLAGDQPVAGDWLGTGVVSIGVFRQGAWYFDLNNDGQFEANEGPFYFGLPGDTAIVGDWTGSGSTKFGVFRCPVAPAAGVCTWYLSNATQTAATLAPNANLYNPATTLVYSYGLPGDQPVANNWSGVSNVDQIGVFRCPTPGVGVCSWIVDNVGDGNYRATDPVYSFGLTGDIAVVGDWNGNTQQKRIGVFRGGLWILDINGSNTYATNDIQASFGLPGDKPVVGKWTQ
ncbi:MAG: G1 family glutamic endopeptidase [Bryobacteraceae bacterium]